MRIVLPPSETKTPGGLENSRLDWDSLVFPELSPTRQAIAEDLALLCADRDLAARALGLGARNLDQISDNLQLEHSPVMPAIQRYTGVVFEALGYHQLDNAASNRAKNHVWLFSALFGPLRATDLIPRYRLSWDSSIPGESLKLRWQRHRHTVWGEEFTIDLRSEGYRLLSPLPEGAGVFVRVVKDLSGGQAAGHANKATKGRVVRMLLEDTAVISSVADFLSWGWSKGLAVAEVPENPDEVLLSVLG